MYKAAVAAERAAYEQYQMAVDGAQKEDKASAASMVDAARSTVDEVSALLVDARLTLSLIHIFSSVLPVVFLIANHLPSTFPIDYGR